MCSGSLSASLREFLSSLKGLRAVFVFVGNELRGDDGFGPLVYELIGLKLPILINAGATPEYYTSTIARLNPDALVFVDAIDAGLEPGSIVYGRLEDLEREVVVISTHRMPLSLIAKVIEVSMSRSLVKLLIGVQVGRLGLGEKMSDAVRDAARVVAEAIRGFLASYEEA